MQSELWSIELSPAHYGYFEDFPFFRKGNDLHDCYAVYFLEKGSFEYRMGNGEPQLLKAGEAVICPPDVNFAKSVRETVTMHLIGMRLNGCSPRFPTEPFCYDDDNRIKETLLRLKSLVCQGQIPIERYRAHLISDLWYSVCQLFASPFIQYSRLVEISPLFREMTVYIDTHPDTSLSDLSRSFGCSRVTVNTLFRRHTGAAVGEYIKKTRIERACRLLSQTNQPYKAIAPLCGFGSEYYFASVFKKETGFTPGEYRKKTIF